MKLWVEFFLEDDIERRFEPLARAFAIDGHILATIRNPDIGYGGGTELPSHLRTNFAAGDAVIDPELAHMRIAMGKRRAVVGEGVRKVSRIEIEPETALPGPVDPALEMGRGDLIAPDFLAAEIGVTGVQIHAMFARQKRECQVDILPQLIKRPRLPGIISGGLDTAAA
jgi:hypothetical protein